MTPHGHNTVAFFVAPLAVPLVLWAGELLLDYPGSVPSGLSGSLLVNLVIALPFAYLAEVVFGLPLWKVFLRFRVASPIAFAAAGAVIGVIPALFLPAVKLQAVVLCALAGAASALLFRGLVRAPELLRES